MGHEEAGSMTTGTVVVQIENDSTRAVTPECVDLMYRSFYKLHEKPFSLLPDPAFFYVSGKHRKALAKLRSGILNRAGTTLITGEIGSGKTTLIQHLIRELEGEVRIGLINNIHSRFDDLLEWVLQAFDIEVADSSDVKLHRAFVSFVKEQTAQGRSALLFVDDAQNMSARVLEELRMLMNINVDHPAFQVVLVGQPELRRILERRDMRQFAQRVVVEHHLQALDEAETINYIHHRLKVAGGDPALFTAEAGELIYWRSQGVPRLINSLCDTVLEYGYEEKRECIDGALVRDILNDSVNGKLLALMEHHPAPKGVPTLHTKTAVPVANATEAVDAFMVADHAEGEQRAQQRKDAPLTGDRPFTEHATAGIPAGGQVPGERPKSLDEALKTLSDFLD
jgi:type II secretory pathway predicted ATPase ExeA